MRPKDFGRTWSRPVVAPLMGDSLTAYQALGLRSPEALRNRFDPTKCRKPWPERFRRKLDGVWYFDIQGLRDWIFSSQEEKPADAPEPVEEEAK